MVHAVNDAFLDVAAGEFAGLVGETGCGKSTLGMAITGLLEKGTTTVKGRILFEGVDLLKKTNDEMREIRRTKMSLIFQDPTAALNPVYTVGDQITEAIMSSRRLSKAEAAKETAEMLSLLRIPDPVKVMRQYPHEFSGGMRQRAMIAVALSKNPKLVIADEPTSNLDATIQAQILDLMKELEQKWNMSTLLITHDMGVVAQTCDKVAVMYAGQVIESGTLFQVFKKPSHPYTQGLLRVANLAGEKTRLESIAGTVPDLVDLPVGCLFSPRCHLAQKKCFESRPTPIEVQEGHFVTCLRESRA
jgi:oligopeptide/dipeptide ABC transporter ATP-binding protein